MAKMWKTGYTGKGKADYVKLGAAQMILIVNIGHIQLTVRVPCHQRFA